MRSRKSEIHLLNGAVREDMRGSVRFVNQFSMRGVKRFYHVRNSWDQPIRAFHGHMKEEKYVYVVRGKILLCLVPMSHTVVPDRTVRVERFELSDHEPCIVHIPAGYANGFRILVPQTDVIFFSTSTLEESQQDDFRFDPYYWGDVWGDV